MFTPFACVHCGRLFLAGGCAGTGYFASKCVVEQFVYGGVYLVGNLLAAALILYLEKTVLQLSVPLGFLVCDLVGHRPQRSP